MIKTTLVDVYINDYFTVKGIIRNNNSTVVYIDDIPYATTMIRNDNPSGILSLEVWLDEESEAYKKILEDNIKKEYIRMADDTSTKDKIDSVIMNKTAQSEKTLQYNNKLLIKIDQRIEQIEVKRITVHQDTIKKLDELEKKTIHIETELENIKQILEDILFSIK